MTAEKLCALAAVTVFFVSAGSIGTLLNTLLPKTVGRVERFAFAMLGGSGVISVVLFLIGYFHFDAKLVWAILGAGLICGAYRLLLRRHFLRATAIWFTQSITRNRLALLLLLVPGLVFSLHFIAALTGPVGGIENDEVSYQLLGPKTWIEESRIRPLLNNSPTAYPIAANIIFAAVAAISNWRAPEIAATVMFFILLMQVYGLSRKLGLPVAVSLGSVAIVSAMNVVNFTSGKAFVDITFSAFSLAAVRLALDYRDSGAVILAGTFAGCAVATKYLGIVVFAATALALILSGITDKSENRPSLRTMVRYVMLFIGIGVVVGAPCYLRNYLMYGMPTYPIRMGPNWLFSTTAMSSKMLDVIDHYFYYDRGQGLGRGLREFLLLPFNFTYRTEFFHGGGGIGAMLLAYAPIGIWVYRRNRLAMILVIWTGLLVCVWFKTVQEARFTIHMLGVLTVLAMGAVWHARKISRFAVLVTYIVAVCSVGVGLAQAIRIEKKGVRAGLNEAYALEYRRQSTGYWDGIDFLNHQPDVQNTVVLSGEIPVFYLHVPYIQVNPLMWPGILPDVQTSPDAALRNLEQRRITHVIDRVQSKFMDVRPVILKSDGRFELLFESEWMRIYRVKHSPATSEGSGTALPKDSLGDRLDRTS